MDKNQIRPILESSIEDKIARQNGHVRTSIQRASDELLRLLLNIDGGRMPGTGEVANAILRLQEAETARITAIAMAEVLHTLR